MLSPTTTQDFPECGWQLCPRSLGGGRTGEQSKNESAVAAFAASLLRVLCLSVCLGAPNSVPSSTHRPWAEREVRRGEDSVGREVRLELGQGALLVSLHAMFVLTRVGIY